MYLQRFGLRREPFSIAPDPRTLFLSERHREALAHLRFGAQGGGGFVLLTGAIGAGKTTVCRAFLEQLPPHCRVAYVFNPQLSSLELLQTVCEEFGVDVGSPAPSGAKGYIDPLNRFLLERHAAGDHCLLVVDEAQCLAAPVLEQLRLLTNLETDEHKLLQILLIGQPELRDMLARPELEQLAQRVIARYHLGALSAAETAAYVSHRLRLAGWTHALPFDARALAQLHALTGGVPRRINLLADRALLALYARDSERATPALLRQLARELAGNETPATRGRERAWMIGGLLLSSAAVAAAALWWQGSRTASPPTAPQVSAQPAQPAQPAQAASASPAPAAAAATPLNSFANRDAALRALGARWGETALPAEPCAPPPGALRCWSAKLSLPALRALDRPGVLTLVDADGALQTLLLQRLGDDSAELQGADGVPQRWPLLRLANRWSGDYQTLWRAPPTLRDSVPPDASGTLADWLDAQLNAAGVPGSPDRAQRVAEFQRREGLKPDGLAGPLTLMRLAQRADPSEPRLLAAPR